MEKYIKLFFHRIVKDLKQKELLPLKFLFFMHSSTILVLYPYLTIHMRALGINVEETAIMSAVTPVVAILMPPVAGLIADKIGNFRVMLAAFSVIGGCSALLLLLVPAGRITLTYPRTLVYGLSCETNPVISLYQEHYCNPVDPNGVMKSEFKLRSCGLSCHAVLNDNYTKLMLASRTYMVETYEPEDNSSSLYEYSLREEDIFEPQPKPTSQHHRILKVNDKYRTSVRQLSKSYFYFPTTSMYNFTCNSTDPSEMSCMLGDNEDLAGSQDISRWSAGIQLLNDNLEENRYQFKMEYITTEGSNNENHNLKCLRGENSKKISVKIPLSLTNSSVKDLELSSCSPQCLVTSPREHICRNPKTTVELDMAVTFWSYLCVRVFVSIISGTSFAMFEGAVIAILREHKADYGLQRIYATIGGMISSPISGLLIDYASRGKEYTDFRPIFFLYASLKVVSGVLMLFINLEFKKAAASVISDVLTVLKKVELIALFTSCVILGSAWGFIESFLFWLLDDLGGSKSLMGLTVTVGGCVGIPLLVLSGPIIKKVGHANVISIGFIFYAIRLLGYSLLYNPWYCLIFEAMESITFGLSFTAAVTYAAKLSTVTTDTSVQGMLGGLYYGVGKGVGSLIGGYLIKPYGIRSTFQAFSIATIIIGFCYWGFYQFYMKQHPSQGTDITKKDVTKSDQEEKEKAEIADIQADLPVVFEDAMCNPAYQTTEDEDIKNDAESVNKIA